MSESSFVVVPQAATEASWDDCASSDALSAWDNDSASQVSALTEYHGGGATGSEASEGVAALEDLEAFGHLQVDSEVTSVLVARTGTPSVTAFLLPIRGDRGRPLAQCAPCAASAAFNISFSHFAPAALAFAGAAACRPRCVDDHTTKGGRRRRGQQQPSQRLER